jgi:cell surface protein SprA
MRSLNSTNFEQGNVEYIQLWILDPFVGNGKTAPDNVGKIYFNLEALRMYLKMEENNMKMV